MSRLIVAAGIALLLLLPHPTPSTAGAGTSFRAIKAKVFRVKRKKQQYGSSIMTPAAKKKIAEHGCVGDAHGHIRANDLGGKTEPNNIFPQNPTINSGKFRAWEQHLINTLNSKEGNKYKYDSFKIKISFTFDNKSEKPRRPTSVAYCYWGHNRVTNNTDNECRTFPNPPAGSCEDPDFKTLVTDINKHIEDARETRKTALRLEDTFLDKACRRDFERLGDAEWKAANDDYKKDVQSKVEGSFERLEREHHALKRRLQPYVRHESETLKKRAKTKVSELDANYKTLLNARKGHFTAGGSLRFKAAREFNIKQSKAMQDKMQCRRRGQGDVVVDCRVDLPPKRMPKGMKKVKKCTFYEIAPKNYHALGILRARAQKRARAFNDKTKGKRYADVQGGSNCEGKYRWDVMTYTPCRFDKMPKTGKAKGKSRRPKAKRASSKRRIKLRPWSKRRKKVRRLRRKKR